MPTLRSRTVSSAREGRSPNSSEAALSLNPATPAFEREVSQSRVGAVQATPTSLKRVGSRKTVQRLFDGSVPVIGEPERRISKRLRRGKGEALRTEADTVFGLEWEKAVQMEKVTVVGKGKQKMVDVGSDSEDDFQPDFSEREPVSLALDADSNTVFYARQEKVTVADKGKRTVVEIVSGSEEDYHPGLSESKLGSIAPDAGEAAQVSDVGALTTRSSRNRGVERRGHRATRNNQLDSEMVEVGAAGDQSTHVHANETGAGSSRSLGNRHQGGSAADGARTSTPSIDGDGDPSSRVQANDRGAGSRRSSKNELPNGEVAKARFLEIARRRAAHFAHFPGEAEEATLSAVDLASGPHADEQNRRAAGLLAQVSAGVSRREPEGGEREDWPGPWSTAMRLVKGRAAAAAARLDSTAANEDKSKPLVQWSPSRQSDFKKYLIATSLQEICIDVLCNNIEHVQSLVGVPEATKNRITTRLCAQRSMRPPALRLYFHASPAEIFIPDCTLATEEILSEGFAQCAKERLEALELGLCGRGFSDQLCATCLAPSANSMPKLSSLVLKGAYRLTNNGLTALLRAAPQLTVLDLTQCSMITEVGIEAVADSVGPKLNTLSLESCSQLEALKILPFLLKMSNLEKLSLSGISGMSDGIVSEVVVTIGSNLKELSIADCRALTDEAVGAVSLCCDMLRLLDLSNIPMLTDAAIGSLADGCRSLRALRLNRGKFSDTAVAAFVTASGQFLRELSVNSVRQVADHTLIALSKHSKDSLEQLDVSWCRKVSDQALGLLADSCPALSKLLLFGCTQVTDLFLMGHSNPKLTIIGLSEKLAP